MSNYKIYDITLILEDDLPIWPGDPPAQLIKTAQIVNGDEFNGSRMDCSVHWGTHVDAPFHFNQNGWTIDQIPLDVLIGKVTVIEILDKPFIDADHLKCFNWEDVDRLIIKTSNSYNWGDTPKIFNEEYIALTENGASFLIDKNIKLVGMDCLSIDRFTDSNHPVHHLFCGNNVVIVEGLDLREVESGGYDIFCLPLKIKDSDGAPARVILKK